MLKRFPMALVAMFLVFGPAPGGLGDLQAAGPIFEWRAIMAEKDHASEFPELQALQTPIEFYVDDQGRSMILTGHRRIAALRLLAEINTPGFAADMPIQAIEVVNPKAND